MGRWTSFTISRRRAGRFVPTVVDSFSRYSSVIDPRFCYREEGVVSALEGACATIGYPKLIKVDQGSELVSRDLDLWLLILQNQDGAAFQPATVKRPENSNFRWSKDGKRFNLKSDRTHSRRENGEQVIADLFHQPPRDRTEEVLPEKQLQKLFRWNRRSVGM